MELLCYGFSWVIEIGKSVIISIKLDDGLINTLDQFQGKKQKEQTWKP